MTQEEARLAADQRQAFAGMPTGGHINQADGTSWMGNESAFDSGAVSTVC